MADRELRHFRETLLHELGRVAACLEGLDDEQAAWRPPAPEANSLFVMATHVLGATQSQVLESLCGQPSTRDRDAEFRASGPVAPLRDRYAELRERITTALDALDAAALGTERETRYGRLTGRELLLRAVRHSAEHAGQAELTRDLLRAHLARNA